MKSAFPFKDPQAGYLHRKVVAEIRRPDYHFRLPYLNKTSWSTICNNPSERERLEFVGDALIGAYIAEELYKQRPHAGPGYYTIARSILTANSTFAHLMHKAGLLHDLSRSVKPAGDAFETILAALHSEQGVKAFQAYAGQCFLPLIETAGLAYDEFRTNKTRQRKHKRMALKPTPSPGSKHIKKGKSRAKANKLLTMTLNANSTLPKRTEPQHRSSTSIRAPAAIIDLTEDSDTEQESPSNGKMQDFRFRLFNKPDQVSDSNISTTDDIRDLLVSISTSSALISVRKDSEGEPKISAGHAEDAVQDDLVTRFKNTSLLGTMHNPITID